MLKAKKIRNVSDKAIISDGGEVILSCSNSDCKQPLVRLWITRPDARYTWKVKATCPYCDGESETEEVCGMFHQAPYSYDFNEETLEDEGELYINGMREEDNVVVLIIKRHENGRKED